MKTSLDTFEQVFDHLNVIKTELDHVQMKDVRTEAELNLVNCLLGMMKNHKDVQHESRS